MKTYKIKATETTTWEIELQANSKEEIEQKLEDEWTELFDFECSDDYQQDYEITEVTNG